MSLSTLLALQPTGCGYDGLADAVWQAAGIAR